MSRGRCYVELVDNKPVRILRQRWQEPAYGGVISEYPRLDATRLIREAVYKRSAGQCEKCSKRLTWRQMHMHEVIPRGQNGEVSIANSIVLCADCHIGQNGHSAHRNRKWNR